MNYEERYKEALDLMKDCVPDENGLVHVHPEDIFPELRESEDDRIRKGIIRNLEYLADRAEGFVKDELKERIAWLEKQGKQKPEKKELKKIEQTPTENKGMNIDEESMTPFQKKVFCIIDTAIEEEQGLKQVCDELLDLASNEIEQKPAWSEEDEGFLNLLLAIFKVEHPNGIFSTGNITVFNGNSVTSNRIIDWLKSIKQRHTWKPSEEQLKFLQHYADQSY